MYYEIFYRVYTRHSQILYSSKYMLRDTCMVCSELLEIGKSSKIVTETTLVYVLAMCTVII